VSPKAIRDIWNRRTWAHATASLAGGGGDGGGSAGDKSAGGGAGGPGESMGRVSANGQVRRDVFPLKQRGTPRHVVYEFAERGWGGGVGFFFVLLNKIITSSS
jgi:hypothetical protein